MWTTRETRRWAKYERRRDASQKAAEAKAEREEALRLRMEGLRSQPPARLTREEMWLIEEKFKLRRRNLLSQVRSLGTAVRG